MKIDRSQYNLYVVYVKFTDALSLPEGPQQTAAIAAWIQSLFSKEDQVLMERTRSCCTVPVEMRSTTTG